MPYTNNASGTILEKQRKYALKNADKIRVYLKEYRSKFCSSPEFKKRRNKHNRELYHGNTKLSKKNGTKYADSYLNTLLLPKRAEKKQADRAEIFRLEGNKCRCCGISDPMYYQLDHVKNDGHLDRPSKNNKRKSKLYITLKRYLENPEKYQLLCANCNQAKQMNNGKLYKPKKRRKAA